MSSIRSRYWRIVLGACDSQDGKVYSRRQPSACFINRPFLRLAGAGYLIPLPVEPRGKAMSIDRILIARVLFTLMTAGYAALTVIADFNKTHATNPEWTPHARSEEHTSELQSLRHLVCRLLLEKKKHTKKHNNYKSK